MGNVVKNPSDVLGITIQESNTQNEAIRATDTDTKKKFGPAASHMGGNPTSGGGINRPTRGRA